MLKLAVSCEGISGSKSASASILKKLVRNQVSKKEIRVKGCNRRIARVMIITILRDFDFRFVLNIMLGGQGWRRMSKHVPIV